MSQAEMILQVFGVDSQEDLDLWCRLKPLFFWMEFGKYNDRIAVSLFNNGRLYWRLKNHRKITKIIQKTKEVD